MYISIEQQPIHSGQACQQLGNMCVLSLYSYSSLNQPDEACNMYKFIGSDLKLSQW